MAHLAIEKCVHLFESTLWFQVHVCQIHHKLCPLLPGPLNINNTVLTDQHTYIGRSRTWGPTGWGNPFRCGCHGRADAISKFEKYLLTSGLLEKLHNLHGKILVCHCAPLPCHGDILIKHLYKLELKEL